MKLKDLHNIKLKTRQGHCYRTWIGLLMFIGAVLYLAIHGGKAATVVFVGVQLIFWSVYL